MSAVAARPRTEVRRAMPVQARAHRTVEKLADATREAIALHGRDGFTTSQVATIAGVSIGVVYRYFPDRIALLEHVYPGGFLTASTPAEVAQLGGSAVVLTKADEAYQWDEVSRHWYAAGVAAQYHLTDEQLLEVGGPLRILFAGVTA